MEFRINDDKVDAEHVAILQILDAFMESTPREYYDDMLLKLKNHIITHFIDEEFIFEKQYKMPEEYIRRHKKEHIDLRTTVLNKIHDIASNDYKNIHEEVLEIKRLISNHIYKTDAEMNQYIPKEK